MFRISNYNKKKLENFLEKRRSGKNVNTSIVNRIVADIKKNKNKSVLKYEKKFSKNNKLKPTLSEINKSIKHLNPKVKEAIDFAFNRIKKFHQLQKVKSIKYTDTYKNKIDYRVVPIHSAGIYVPANLPSTLLMNAIPARICGVKRLVLANPRINGQLNPAVMYVAKKCNIKEIITVGGAQAIASMAYIQKVNKIFGPGNDYVAKAKQIVFGDVGIEGMIAGPSEVTVVADDKTNIDQAVTSMAAQSEHGHNSQSILITKSKKFIKRFNSQILFTVRNLSKKKIIEASFKRNGLIILAKNDNEIIEAINLISPEHLELLSKNNQKYLNKINNAGCIGIGTYSPVAASDYNVGTNHTLGVMGSARFASGLNINDFCKKISIFNLTKKGVAVIGEKAITLAEYEKLDAHVLSLKSRMRRM